MSIPRPDHAAPRARRGVAALLGVTLAASALPACTAGQQTEDGDTQGTQADQRASEPADAAPTSPTPPARPDLARVLQRLLDDRARAIRAGRQRAFERTLAGGDQAALVIEERLFHNFTTLPLTGFGYRLDPRGIRRDGDRVIARVRRSVQLRDYDQVAVSTPDRVRFVRAPGARRGWLISSATDEEWRLARGVPLQAWDLERIEVRERAGVLLVLDSQSLAAGPALLRAVERGVADVSPRIPTSWDGSVVVYALADDRFLRRLGDLPGGNPERLDAVTFPVRSRGAMGRLASSRVVLAPGVLARPDQVRDRLVRHELVHVALGVSDDAVPTWLAEGLAEWVSAAGLPEEQRTIAGATVRAAVDGAGQMPADDTFNEAGAGANYGIAWYAVEYIADTWGPAAVWDLFSAMRRAARATGATGLGDEAADEVLLDVLGIDGAELADAASRKVVATFG